MNSILRGVQLSAYADHCLWVVMRSEVFGRGRLCTTEVGLDGIARFNAIRQQQGINFSAMLCVHRFIHSSLVKE